MFRSKSLFKNFTWLSISQGANFLVPLIAYPYLLRITQIEEFGLIAFAQAVVTYLVHFVDYGFSITAVREISLNRERPNKVSAIFNKLYFTKLMLLLLSFVIFYLLTTMISAWSNFSPLFLSSFLIVIGQMLLPIWFFQGIEKMSGVALMNIISKVLFALFIFLFINESNDFQWVNFYLGASQIMVGLVAIRFIFVRHHIKINPPSFVIIISQLKANWSIFLSVFSGFVANNSNLVILGLMTDPVSTAYYAIVEKVLLAIRAPAVLLYQTIFPKVCLLAEKSFDHLISFLKTIVRLTLLSFIPLAIIVYIFSDDIVHLFSGEYLKPSSYLLKIICVIPLFAALNIPATQTMLAYDLKKSYANITIGGAVFNITINIILVSAFSAYGSAVAALATELFITLMLFLNLRLFHSKYSVFGAFKLSR
ncbi:oligosaccharide flippase family protein [Fulvivirga sp. 29W222]|uniref:Oligosaccharide flippase family protein n=1 Tax=Fulvivirga marina TaxID=2494733 RepID=A0A937G180_9BACT|nr:oligosaccharide flippase family protein [Fulvivirga marina]MBL6449789.1 oligosaccharide flippase family protein [Fulvivirga marina]